MTEKETYEMLEPFEPKPKWNPKLHIPKPRGHSRAWYEKNFPSMFSKKSNNK